MTKANSVVCTVSMNSQIIFPREVRERRRVGGHDDRVRYILDADSVRIEKETAHEHDERFATFSELSSDADEEAYGVL